MGLTRQKLSAFWAYVKQKASCNWHQFATWCYIKWLYWKPKLDKITQAIIAISAATSILRISIGIMPIILSILTVLATAPLFNYILPNVALTPFSLMPLLIVVSCIAGYFKYRELVIRARLDQQIEANQQQILHLQRRVTTLEKSANILHDLPNIGSVQNDPVQPVQFSRLPEPNLGSEPKSDPERKRDRIRARSSA